MFDTSVFKRPSGRGDLATDFSNVKFRGPGFNKFDVSSSRTSPCSRIYNLFNHTQFSG